MLRVYLDQNKWVDLARAATGHPDGDRFQDALAMCRAGVETGAVSFPLDMYRYWETAKRNDDRSRHDLAAVMRELSAGHTMATPTGVLDQELDAALQARFGVPTTIRDAQVFGTGVSHIMGGHMARRGLDLTDYPELEAVLPPGTKVQLDALVNESVEQQILRAGPETHRRAGRDLRESNHAVRFVEFENKVAAAIQEKGLTRQAVDIAVRATDLGDIRPAVVTALERIGMTFEDFMRTLGEVGLLEFMDDLPTRYITNVLRSAKHRQSEQRWEPNDFVDILALPVAGAYCDVVVTEKQWAHRMTQGKVPDRYGTRVMSNVADLFGAITA